MKTQFKVEKMMCGGCSSNIKKALSDVAEIDAIDIDLENKIVTIEGEIKADEIASIMTKAGYPATVI